MLYRAHFQLTGRCNLACRFCGQSKGMLASGSAEIAFDRWLELAAELSEFAQAAKRRPEVMLWGGEPLLYPYFSELACRLHENGFMVGVVTNATLVNRHAEAFNRCIDCIYVSMDGYGVEHDAVRGAGVFERVCKNLALLRHRRGKLIFLTTVSDANVEHLAELPALLAKLGPDEIVLQQLMYLSESEISAYRSYSRKEFGCDYPELEVWHREDDRAYLTALQRELNIINDTVYPVPVRSTSHRYPKMADVPACEAPLNRVHIRHDGAVGFCTDYFGFSAGNIHDMTLREIFFSDRAERYRMAVRQGCLPICDHCPWHLQYS